MESVELNLGRGVFEFIGEKGTALYPDNPYIRGGNPWLKWSDIEHTEGVYNWSRMDELINQWTTLEKRLC